jgi:hypothetical protein
MANQPLTEIRNLTKDPKTLSNKNVNVIHAERPKDAIK